MITTPHTHRGFALPTILIASVVMLVVLVAAVSATSSVRSALDGQYYNRLAREAAESGIARANQCLQDSAFIPQWSNTNNLRPNTTCSGGAACTNADSCFVMNSTLVRTTFSIGLPTTYNSSQLIVSVGKVELLRPSNGSVARTYTYAASGRIGIDLNFKTVAFGYDGRDGGAYFATVSADGKMNAAGFNFNGWLGNGTTTSTLVPTPFQLNAADRAAAIFAGFQSQGFNMYAITDKGTVYGAGLNDEGQLGDGTLTNRSTPVKFGLPAGLQATNVVVGGRATFVTTSDNKVYASGQCDRGSQGTTYTISGCTDRTTPAIVKLPTPTSDPNTIPTNNFLFDANSAVVIMQGGRVYSWGGNGYGQLGDGTITDSATPIKIGTYGDTGQPKAVDIAFDGDSIYIVGDDGSVKAAGRNTYGELGGDKIAITMASDSKCMENTSGNGVDVRLATCSAGATKQQWAFRSDGSLYNAGVSKCLEDINGSGTDLRLATCSSAAKQSFTLQNDGTLKAPASNSCMNNKGGDDVTLILYTCNGSGNEVLALTAPQSFVNFQLPAGAGNAVKVDTDQWSVSVLTDSGQVWSAGRNEQGQLGNGSTATYQPSPVQFILPSGVTATDITSSAFYGTSSTISNLFVIGSDGKVYGTGSNDTGQLGDGTTTERHTPVPMDVIDGVSAKARQVQSGFGTTVILTYGKKLYTVGNNNNGQLGDGTTVNSLVPKTNRYTNVLPLAIF